MALNFLFGLLELGCGYSAGGVVAVLCLRLAIIVSLTAFLFISLDDRIHRIMDPLALGLYTVSSATDRLVLFSVISGSLVVRCTIHSGRSNKVMQATFSEHARHTKRIARFRPVNPSITSA